MAHYLVKARPLNLADLRTKLNSGEIKRMRPFGEEMHQALSRARLDYDGTITWEEQCFCSPPLKAERSVLDNHFDDLQTESVQSGAGWARIDALPLVWDNSSV